jgi:hypothetical protein
MKTTLPSLRHGAARTNPAERHLLPKLVLLAFALLVTVAIVADMHRLRSRLPEEIPSVPAELQNILLGLGGPRYVDPKGLFSVVQPAGWRAATPPESDSYNVAFYGPNGADMSIMATPVDYDDLPSLFKDIEKSERQTSIRTEHNAIRFQGRAAVRRTCKLHHVRVLAIDFVENRVAHHILCTTPPELFEQYEPVLMEVINTYQTAHSGAQTP